MDFVVKNLIFQGDADAAGFTIHNLDLSGLNLTKSSVGLGNVDNTSDANKPVSTAQAAAIALKEPIITGSGNATDYWGGDKVFHALGALALQAGNTTLQELTAIGLNAAGASLVGARRNDWASTFADISLVYFGASSVSSLLGLSAANGAALRAQNASNFFIYTNTTAPLIFGHNSIRRMRLMTGLNVGGDTDPGIGCIEASDAITAAHFEGDDLALTGDISSDGGAAFGGSNVIIEAAGDITAAGAIEAALGFTTPSTIVGGGNMAVAGSIISFSGLPTSDPGVPGRLYRTGGDVRVSI